MLLNYRRRPLRRQIGNIQHKSKRRQRPPYPRLSHHIPQNTRISQLLSDPIRTPDTSHHLIGPRFRNNRNQRNIPRRRQFHHMPPRLLFPRRPLTQGTGHHKRLTPRPTRQSP